MTAEGSSSGRSIRSSTTCASIFDGIVVRTPTGTRFVDAPEVARITERTVTLTIGAAEAEALPPRDPKGGGGEFQANPKSRFRPWRRTSRAVRPRIVR